MKKLLLFLFPSLSIAFAVSCSSHPVPETPNDPKVCTAYACPVHPDRTSTKQENCPLCNKPMVPVPQKQEVKPED